MLKHPMLNFKKIMNNKGMTIIEVLVAAGLAAVVGLGITTMMQNMFIEQKKTVLFATLKDLKYRIENTVRDPSAWSNSINAAGYNTSSRFADLRALPAGSVDITGVTYSTPEKVVLFDGSNALSMNLLGPAATAGNGFTETGAVCTTFSAVASSGVDACPISYRILIGFACPGAATACGNPQMRILGRLLYNPATGGLLNRFRSMINPIASIDITNLNSNSIGKYDAIVERTLTMGNRAFTIASQFIAPLGNASVGCSPTNGGGQCTVGGTFDYHPRASINGWTLLLDNPSLVDVSLSPVRNFRLKEAGGYACTITGAAFATGGLELQLYNETTGAVIASAATVAGRWAESSLTIDTKFNQTTTDNDYVIKQRCDDNLALFPTDLGVTYCTLGVIPSAGYAAGIRTNILTVNCYKFDKNN